MNRIIELQIGNESRRIGDINGFLVCEGVELRQDTYYIVCPCSIGDTLYAACMVESFKKYNHMAKKVCLIVKSAHRQIPDWFDAVDEKIVSDDMVRRLDFYSILTGTWRLENYLYGHFQRDRNSAMLPVPKECRNKDIVYQYKKLVFRIPSDCALEEPKIVPQWDLFENLTEEYGIGDNTILLLPYANSAKLLAVEFWETLAERLGGLGYQVYTNVKGDEELPVKGTRRFSADIATAAALCENCRLVIALRSGLCDVLAFTETRLAIINNDERLLKGWNLKDVVDREHIYNLRTSNSNIMASILEILGHDPLAITRQR